MAGSVPRAIVELEQLRAHVHDAELRELVEVLLRLLTSTDLGASAEHFVQHYLSPDERKIFNKALKNAARARD